ncbi:MAG: di-trans,poly-cis-decaprenylcistransferase [Gemmatimonadaceae bacterium]
MPASSLRQTTSPLHVAIIMDGNGRWATARALPRVAGHRAGAESVRRVVEAAPKLGVRTLTLFAFSTDNWKRPHREVAALMRLFRAHLECETPKLVANGVRLRVIGRRDRLGDVLRGAIERAELATSDGTTLDLRVAIDYSARDAILRAAAQLQSSVVGHHVVSRETFAALLSDGDAVPDVDLLIRTSGEQRLSDFLLWECAYAELHFTPRLWPEFGADNLASAIDEFRRRERRFGAVPDAAAG